MSSLTEIAFCGERFFFIFLPALKDSAWPGVWGAAWILFLFCVITCKSGIRSHALWLTGLSDFFSDLIGAVKMKPRGEGAYARQMQILFLPLNSFLKG